MAWQYSYMMLGVPFPMLAPQVKCIRMATSFLCADVCRNNNINLYSFLSAFKKMKKNPKISIRLVAIGKIVAELNIAKLLKWKSEIFHICPNIETPVLHQKADLGNWGYSDCTIEFFLL